MSLTNEEKLLIARANRILKAARQRVAGGEKYAPAMRTALKFANKKVKNALGGRGSYLKTTGLSQTKINKILDVARGITESKYLTIKGIRETEKKQLSRFYSKDISEVTAKEKEVFLTLRDTGVLEKIREVAYMHSSLAGAAMEIAPKLDAGQVVEALTDYVNNRVMPEVGQGNKDLGVRERLSFHDYIYERYIGKNKT